MIRPRFGLWRVRSPLLTLSLVCFLFLRVLRCFSSPGSPPVLDRMPESPPAGCPIRKSAAVRVFAPHRGLSQLVTSFFASESPGILHAPFSPFLFSFSPRDRSRFPKSRLRRTCALCHTLFLVCSCFFASIMSMCSFLSSPWQS